MTCVRPIRLAMSNAVLRSPVGNCFDPGWNLSFARCCIEKDEACFQPRWAGGARTRNHFNGCCRSKLWALQQAALARDGHRVNVVYIGT